MTKCAPKESRIAYKTTDTVLGVFDIKQSGEIMGRKTISGREPITGKSITLTIDNGLIVSVDAAPRECDLWISAGLIDLQVNGYRGFDLNSDTMTSETVSALTRALLATGVTTFAPTIITAPEPKLLHRLSSIAQAYTYDLLANRCIPYIHVEGPHISPLDGYRGAHPLTAVRSLSLEEFDRWQAACDGLVGLVTLSPHYPNSVEYISTLVKRGVHISIGHTHASPTQIHAAVQAGARLSTHLGNGIALQIDRHPNPIWSQLADDGLTAGFIADGQHLSADALKAMIRAKGSDKSFLISDAVALADLPIEDSVVEKRTSEEVGGRLLAGALVPLITCVGRAIQMTGRSLGEVLLMATENPGRFAGDRGRLIPGARADIFRFRWTENATSLTIQDLWLDGEPMSLDL